MMAENLTIASASLPGWLAGGAGAGIGSVATLKAMQWFAVFVSGRADKREEIIDKRSAVLDEATSKMMSAMQSQIDRLVKRVDAQDDEITELRAQLKECREGHAGAAAEVLRLKAIIQGYGDARNMVQRVNSAEAIAVKGAA